MDGAIWRDLVFRGITEPAVKHLCWQSGGRWWAVPPQTFRWDQAGPPLQSLHDSDLVQHIVCTLCGHHQFRNRLQVARHFWVRHPETRQRNPTQLFSTKSFNAFAHCALCFFVAPFCDKVHLELLRHVDHHHRWLTDAQQHVVHVCDTCYQEFNSETLLDEHVSSVHVDHVPQVYRCVRCRQQIHGQQKYISHLLQHYSQYRLACSVCPNFRSRDPETMLQHVGRHERRYLQCDLCPQRSRNYRSMVDHMRRHLGKPSHVCSICGYQANTSSRYHNHMDSHGERKHVCHSCGQQFDSLLKKSRHNLLVHRRPSQMTCPSCGRLFTSRQKLRLHRQQHSGGKRFQCQHCHKLLSSQQSLLRHVADTCPNSDAPH